MIISWLFCLYRVTLYIWQSMLHATYHTHKKICIYKTRVTAHWRQRILLTGLPVLGKFLSLSTSFACIYLKRRIRNLLSHYLSSSEVKKGEYCIEYRRDSIVNSMINQKPFYFNNESKLQLSGLWKGLNKFNRGFAEALIYNLKDTTV